MNTDENKNVLSDEQLENVDGGQVIQISIKHGEVINKLPDELFVNRKNGSKMVDSENAQSDPGSAVDGVACVPLSGQSNTPSKIIC
ncbi:MAG: hypothetical protein ACI4Q6_05455 [Huintestinicola sp.]